MNKNGAIGVIDSGVGGLTVLKEIRKIMPNEDVIYLGDSKNCPYGNRTSEEILELTVKMINFLEKQNVKCVALACNTISTLAEEIRKHFDFPIISIVEAATDEVARKNLSSVGLIGTCFTVNSGAYNRLINQKLPDCKVFSKGSLNLADFVDRGDCSQEEIDGEIKETVGEILKTGDIKQLILGCTHYPIVEENFKKCYPELELINPAFSEADAIKELLKKEDAQNPSGGSFKLYTTGSTDNYIRILDRLSSDCPSVLETITL